MKRAKGFTLVELVIVIVIVGILSIVAVPIYRGYTRKAMATEGKSLLGTVQTAQKIYYTENAVFASVGKTSFTTILDVDARPNKYFSTFQVWGSGDNWSAITTGTGSASGIILTIKGSKTGQAEWSESGLNNA